MNQETIPDNNLPAYLQRYDVVILNDKEESVGNVLYTTVGAIPSNKKEKRVWQLNLTGYLKPNVDTYNIVYDFSDVDYKYKEQVTFQNIVSGTFNICGKVLDASKIIGFDYSYSDKESTLTIKLDTSKWDFRLKKEVLFSYQLNVDDTASCTGLYYPPNIASGAFPAATASINSGGNYWTVGSKCYDKYCLAIPCTDPNNYMVPMCINDDGEAVIDVYINTTGTSQKTTLTLSSKVPQTIYGSIFTATEITSNSFVITVTCCGPSSTTPLICDTPSCNDTTPASTGASCS